MQARQTKVLICLPSRERIPRSPHFRPVACIMQGDRGAPAKTYDDAMRGKLYKYGEEKLWVWRNLANFRTRSLVLVCYVRRREKKRKDMRGILCKLLLTDASLIARDPFFRSLGTKKRGLKCTESLPRAKGSSVDLQCLLLSKYEKV